MADDVENPDSEAYEGMMYAVMTPQKMADTNPFDGDCYSTTVNKEVNVSQLADEIAASVGFDVQISFVNSQPDIPVGPDNPAKMYVHPQVDGRVVRGKIRAHQINDDYGFTEDQLRRRELMRKIRLGEELTDAEMREGMRLALTQD